MSAGKLFEVRIHEPAVADGLFQRPERYRLTNMWQWHADRGRVKSLRYGEGSWNFLDGKCEVYDMPTRGYVSAEIVGEIDEGRSMEADRFEVIACPPPPTAPSTPLCQPLTPA